MFLYNSGAISAAGGDALFADREKLPLVEKVKLPLAKMSSKPAKIRCCTGDAVITGPKRYGSLRVPYVIHAVGPNYVLSRSRKSETEDELLRSSYLQSLERAKEENLESVAFSLISSGVFRGPYSREHVLGIGIQAIVDSGGYDELKEVHMVAFSPIEVETLHKVSLELKLEKSNPVGE